MKNTEREALIGDILAISESNSRLKCLEAHKKSIRSLERDKKGLQAQLADSSMKIEHLQDEVDQRTRRNAELEASQQSQAPHALGDPSLQLRQAEEIARLNDEVTNLAERVVCEERIRDMEKTNQALQVQQYRQELVRSAKRATARPAPSVSVAPATPPVQAHRYPGFSDASSIGGASDIEDRVVTPRPAQRPKPRVRPRTKARKRAGGRGQRPTVVHGTPQLQGSYGGLADIFNRGPSAAAWGGH